MWLAFDIGNSAVKGGRFDSEALDHTFVLAHDAALLSSAVEAEIEHVKESGRAVDRVGLASVVPESTDRLVQVIRALDIDLTVIEPNMQLPFDLAYQTPRTLGADRIAAAAAAWHLFGDDGRRNVVVVDAGTAFTYEVVDRSGTFRGGPIAPGPALVQQSLHRNTAQLPDVVLEMPDSPIGRSTTEAIQAGVMYGFIDSVRGLLDRIVAELDGETFVVATGGWSRLLHSHVDAVDGIDAHLVLRGVRILMSMNSA